MIRIAIDGPFDWPAMLAYFRPRAIRGVEHVDLDGDRPAYRRVTPAGGELTVRLSGGRERLVASVKAEHRDGSAGRARVQRLFGLDGAHAEAVAALRRDPLIGPRIRRRPGLRVPGTWDPFETGVRAIVGQQVSVAGASTVTARVVARHGTPVVGLGEGLTYAFPRPATLAQANLDGLGLTGSRIAAIRGFAAAVAGGSIVLDGSASFEAFVASVCEVHGLGPWTAHYLALRAGYPDALPVADLGLQRAAGLDAKALAIAAERWRPFRALAAVHLWEAPPG